MDALEITLVGLFVATFEALGVLTAVHAVMHTRTSQGAIAWLFPLVLFPYLSLPAYWVFGRNRFHGYLIPRREGDTEIQHRVQEGLQTYRERYQAILDEPRDRFAVCERLARLPYSAGNNVKLLIDGDETFSATFAGIEAAKDYVLAQYFIIHDDELGREFQRRLIAKAKEGVRVFLLYDEIGSHSLSKSFLRELSDAGVEVHAFNSTRGWRNRFQLNFRNHRKIVVCDGRVAYVGGLNVGDEYMGRTTKFGGWRDTHLEITGPSVACIQLAFAEDWNWSVPGERLNLNWTIHQPDGADQDVLVLPTGPADELESCGLFFTHIIHSAKRRLWIASPYFVPNEDVVAALNLAALRGVDVRVLLPAKADHLLVYLSSFSFVAECEPTGVQFFRYEPGFLHQKVALVDDDFAAVGTANLDNRSFRLNFEITVAVADRGFASDVEEMLQRDFDRSRQVSATELHDRSFWFRFAVQSSRLMAPVQ